MRELRLKNDRYRKTRGGHARLLELFCAHCGHRLCYYQKDGPGILKRLYVDRMSGFSGSTKRLSCKNCNEFLGVLSIYKKESRLAYKLFVGSIKRKMVAQNNLTN